LKLTEEPPAPPPRVAPKPKPAAPKSDAGKAVAKAQDVLGQRSDQVAAANQVAATSAPAQPVHGVPPPPPKGEAPSAPPAPSLAFRAWVQNLRVGSVRSGASPRVLIERTTYEVGDLVHPQLGIVFDGYNAETRLLRFKDKTGAVVELRN
jgi:hypothetical protein